MSAGIKNDTSRSALIYLKDLENTSKSVAWGWRPNAFHKPDTVSRDWTANRPAGLHRRQRPLGGGVRGGERPGIVRRGFCNSLISDWYMGQTRGECAP
jgi:hypothetical protein